MLEKELALLFIFVAMYQLIRKLLFHFDAERVHGFSMRMLKNTCAIPVNQYFLEKPGADFFNEIRRLRPFAGRNEPQISTENGPSPRKRAVSAAAAGPLPAGRSDAARRCGR